MIGKPAQLAASPTVTNSRMHGLTVRNLNSFLSGARAWLLLGQVHVQGHLPGTVFAMLFASGYFSVITPQGGSKNVIFVRSAYLTQRELYRLGLLTTLFFVAVFLVIGTPWILLVAKTRSCRIRGLRVQSRPFDARLVDRSAPGFRQLRSRAAAPDLLRFCASHNL